jgi:gliding motility-associated-like protein
MTAYRTTASLLLIVFLFSAGRGLSQCTVLGQNPNTAFPVCGNIVFEQTTVPICGDNNLEVPGCAGGAAYADKNPFWYKFTCFQAGSLGFVITPNDLTDDYDWQLYDITGIDPQLIYTTPSSIVTGNWSGSSGTTGASATGVSFIQCASSPNAGAPTFAAMPNLIAGHTYILLVSHFTDSQSGYSLSFGGGTAVITDPKEPHLQAVTADCDGQKLTLKLNKKMKCGSLSATGSEFSILPAVSTVVSAVATNCSASFDFDEVTITLSAPVPSGDYELVIKNGSDANTLLDNCDRTVPQTEQVPFKYTIPQPTPIDSIERIGCAPDLFRLHFSKKIACGSIAADGSDFTIAGTTPVAVSSAYTDCTSGFNDVITVKLSAPIYTAGNYVLSVRPGTDGNTVIDECGRQTLPQTIPFTTVDTVSARFTFTNALGCRNDTLTCSHDGANGVNSWNWLFNNSTTATTPSHTIAFPASSSNSIQLIVSNGTCADTALTTVVLDNEVKAGFDLPATICPEDPLIVTNTSTGLVDLWKWSFDVVASSNSKDPQPVFFPGTNIEAAYTIKLLATNTTLGCTDSAKHRLKVLNNCYIAVPTAFTPNNDGKNDYLYPNNAIKAENLEFTVYNRWGQVVFHSRDWTQKWDGTIGGIPQASGVYVWMLKYTHRDTKQNVFQKGTTTLIR